MDQGKPRGRPKVAWDVFHEELFRRFSTGEACKTVEAESRALASWAISKSIKVPGGKEISSQRIRERIKKRYGGSQGYKNVLESFAQKRKLSLIVDLYK